MSKALPIQKNFSLQRARELSGGEYRKKQEAKLRQASKMYEAQFLNEMVKAMRKTVSHSKLSKPSFAEKIFQDKLYDNYVKAWGDQGGVGIGKIIYDQIHEKVFPKMAIPPQGPLPINRGFNPIPIDQKSEVPKFKIIQPETMQKKGAEFIFEKSPDSQLSGLEVLNPWSGKISSMRSLTNGRKYLEISHDQGLVSKISFLGKFENLQLNQEIDAGETLGKFSDEALGLSWKIQS